MNITATRSHPQLWTTHTLNAGEREKRLDDQSIKCKIISTLVS